jgi:hypothetical protein
MKWIKSRKDFLNEAKIRDVILPTQAKEVSSKWGEKYLDYEEVEPTDKIKQGRWKLSNEDKIKVLGYFFGTDSGPCDMNLVLDTFKGLSDKFAKILEESIDFSLFKDGADKYKIILENFNAKEPTIDQIAVLYDPVFRKLSINDTKATSIIQKDENGRPLKDEEGNMLRVEKKEGEPVFEKNLVNIKSFVESYNRCYEEDELDHSIFYSNGISNLISLAKENHNSDYKVDFEIFNKDIYLSMNHKSQDILNISISTFYSSCQHLYSGSHRRQLLGNVFDPNSIPAFLIFDTPIYQGVDKISDFLPLSRMIIRNIEDINDDSKEPKIFFDRSYPDRMKEVFDEMVEKYSGNNNNVSDRNTYIYMPDIDISNDDLVSPYMDRLSIVKKPYIGVNTKSIFINRNYDWSSVKMSPKAKIKEIVIETENLPENMLSLDLNPDWVKFKFMKINSLSIFKKIKTDSISFDKCKFDSSIIEELSNLNNISKLQIISCDITGDIKLDKYSKLEELHIIYTLDNIEDLDKCIRVLSNLKKLVISGDLITNKSDKDFISSLKKKIKVEIIGPVI